MGFKDFCCQKVLSNCVVPFQSNLCSWEIKCAKSLEYFHSTQTGDASKALKRARIWETLSYKEVLPDADNLKF